MKKKRTNTKTASLLLLMRTTAPKRGDSLVTGGVILSSVFMGKRFKKGSIKYESTRARFERLIIHIFTAGSQKRSILTEKK